MRDKRYRLNYGKDHENVTIADDEERVYLHGYQVDRLNEYDEKCKVMETKLKELGFELVFIREEWDKDKGFETSITRNPGSNDNGEWRVISNNDYEKFKNKLEDDIR